MKIIGIILVRNEDLYVEISVSNIISFCDRLIILDNYSTDATYEILRKLKQKYNHIDLHRIKDICDSHNYIKNLAGTNSWVFGVDGDEVYDPVGLAKLKTQLRLGNFDNWWVIFGNVLNCSMINTNQMWADGYLAPPCRSMTKLYNFRLITSWDGKPRQRLHGGCIRFKEGYDASMRLHLCQQTDWNHSIFRCLHLCFVSRSTTESRTLNPGQGRLNVTENQNVSPRQRLRSFFLKLIGKSRSSGWKEAKYRRGPLVRKDVSSFFLRENI